MDIIFNPRRACAERVTVVVLCVCLSVCLSVCYHSNCRILGLYVENKVLLGFSWQSQRMYCVDFVENALFKSSGDICWSPPPSSPLDELSVNETDSDRFISRLVVCRSSDSSYNSTDSSLLTVDYQPRFLGLLSLCVLDLLTWHARATTGALRNCEFLWLL